MKTLEQYLSELEKLEKAASPGDWQADGDCDVFGSTVIDKDTGENNCIVSMSYGRQQEKDCEFIAASRNAFPKLLEIIRVQNEALKGLVWNHSHMPNLPHTRAMGDSYGYCDYCHTKVEWGPGEAEEALAAVDRIVKGE